MSSLGSLLHGAWPVERSLWHSGPPSLGGGPGGGADVASVISFSSSVGGSEAGASAGVGVGAARRSYSHQTLGPKVSTSLFTLFYLSSVKNMGFI